MKTQIRLTIKLFVKVFMIDSILNALNERIHNILYNKKNRYKY